MNVIYFYLFILVHPYLAMWWKSFELADRKAWEALVPGYNYYVAFKLGTQKPFWSLLLIFPGVHIVMWSVVNLSYIRRFGYFSLVDTLQGIFFPYILMAKISNSGDKILPETNWANSKEVGDREWGDHLALFLALPVIGHAIALGFAAVSRPKPGKKTKVKEWGDSIWFALIAALIIRTYVFEPFKIPTGSMEKTLMVGDFLFVNKLAYGPKVPVTPVSYPLVHNTIPWLDVKSYLGIETSNYFRLPGYSNVERYDVVVFNFPAGDTAVYDPRMPDGLMGHNYHSVVIKEALSLWSEDISNSTRGMSHEEIMSKYGPDFIKDIDLWKNRARFFIAEGFAHPNRQGDELIKHHGTIYRPVDKRENYIKRCVGIPGDWLELKESVLYVNNAKADVADQQNLLYKIEGKDEFAGLSEQAMMEKFDFDIYTQYQYEQKPNSNQYKIAGVHVNSKTIKLLRKEFNNFTFTLESNPQYSDTDSIPTTSQLIDNLNLFPNDLNINNTVTDFHKFQIPSKGQTIKINKDNIPYYRRIITAYEGHKLVEKENGSIWIDGKEAKTYTFAMNYYWMMGDNRFNSADSRMWGFVPEDHIVGKASMVWFSNNPNGGFRWERMFTVIK